MAKPKTNTKESSRIGMFDVVRGFSVISMVCFHACYDYVFLRGGSLSWFSPPFIDIWRASISWVFIFISGCMFSYSKNNYQRSGKYLAFAFLLYLVTSFVAVDTPISFGVIFCLGASTLLASILSSINALPRGYIWALILFLVFVVCLHVPQKRFGIGPVLYPLPNSLYENPYLSWLGFPSSDFSSGDYYPLIPYVFLYLSGTSVGRNLKYVRLPQGLISLSVKPLSWIGRHALLVYALHQPIILLLQQLLDQLL